MDAQWLLLAHQLPTRPSNARVKTWRRLQEIGAVPRRNSVYVLPNTEPCREDFEWLRSEIVAMGGEATVFQAAVTDSVEAAALIELFRRLRADDYRRLKRDADRLLSSSRSKRRPLPTRGASLRRTIRNLRERFAEIERIDFFQAGGRDDAGASLAELERLREPVNGVEPAAATSRLAVADVQGRRWVTRPRPGVDRMASAWLIRRFIDPMATFAFVAKPGESEIAFDMYEGDFSHRGALCTFEAIAQHFGLSEAPVLRIGHIVHDLDLKETRYGAAETPAIGRLIDGLGQLYPDDHQLLEQGMTMFEALARSFEATNVPPPAKRAAARRTRHTKKRSQ